MDKKIYVATRIRPSRGTHLATAVGKRSPSTGGSPNLRSISPNNSTLFPGNNVFAPNTADIKGKSSKLIAVQENPVKPTLLE